MQYGSAGKIHVLTMFTFVCLLVLYYRLLTLFTLCIAKTSSLLTSFVVFNYGVKDVKVCDMFNLFIIDCNFLLICGCFCECCLHFFFIIARTGLDPVSFKRQN